MKVEEFFTSIRNNPVLAYAIIIAIFVLVLIGYIRRWKWATQSTGNRNSRMLVDLFGYENYRKIMIVMLSLAIAGLFFLMLTA